MPVTLNATAVPLPPLPIAVVLALDQRTVTGVPPRSDKYTQGLLGGGYVATDNYNAAVQDILAKYGTGTYAIMRGYGLSIGTGLNVDIAAGQAVVTGLTESKVTIVKSVDPSIARIHIWLNADGTITTVNDSLTPPGGEVCYLGSCVTNATDVTSVDTSGVVFYKHGHTWRETADTGVPGDAPGLERRFYHRTANATYYWDGLSYILMAGSTVRQGLEANVAGVVTGDVYESTDGPYSEIFDGTSFSQKGPAFPLIKPTVKSTWNLRLGTFTTVIDSVGGGLFMNKLGTAGHDLCFMTKALSGTPVIDVAFLPDLFLAGGNHNIGIGFLELATSKVLTLLYDREALLVRRWTNGTTPSADVAFVGRGVKLPAFFRMQDDGTNLKFFTSGDGLNWTQFYSQLRTTFFTDNPDEYGLCVSTKGTGATSGMTVIGVNVT